MENTIELISEKCVNSTWIARFLAKENQECCQCSFGNCKVAVSIGYNGHNPRTYILTEKEFEDAKKLIN